MTILDPRSPEGQRVIRDSTYERPTTQGDPPPACELNAEGYRLLFDLAWGISSHEADPDGSKHLRVGSTKVREIAAWFKATCAAVTPTSEGAFQCAKCRDMVLAPTALPAGPCVRCGAYDWRAASALPRAEGPTTSMEVDGREARQKMIRASLTQQEAATSSDDASQAAGNVAKSQLDPSGAVASSTLPSRNVPVPPAAPGAEDATITAMQARADEFRHSPVGVPCQCETSWHADEIEGWIASLRAASPAPAAGSAETFALSRKQAAYVLGKLQAYSTSDHGCRQCVGENVMVIEGMTDFVCVRHQLAAWLSPPPSAGVVPSDPPQDQAAGVLPSAQETTNNGDNK